jgi:hypothetical protein
MNPPKFCEKSPQARVIQRLYNGRKMQVWEATVKIASIEGWASNPRIELAVKQYQANVGNRELTQDEVFDLMKQDPEFKLRELRDDILKNGLREPLVLTYVGKLLDGNRRFFALKYLLNGMPASNPNRVEYEKVPAYVLMDTATEEDERHVLVEENFAASLKLEWPDYVKARHIKADADEGLKTDELAAKYAWPKSKIKETIKIWEIIDEFISFATSPVDPEDKDAGGLGLTEPDAERVAAERYQYFNEAHKSFFDELKTDFDFKTQFFKWIKEGKFSSFSEVRIAYKAWNNPEVKPILMGPEPTAAKEAKAVLEYNARVVHGGEEVGARIETFVNFLKGLKVEQVASLPDKSIDHLREALSLLQKMAEAAAKAKKKKQ